LFRGEVKDLNSYKIFERCKGGGVLKRKGIIKIGDDKLRIYVSSIVNF
jgi:hypothetical protein